MDTYRLHNHKDVEERAISADEEDAIRWFLELYRPVDRDDHIRVKHGSHIKSKSLIYTSHFVFKNSPEKNEVK